MQCKLCNGYFEKLVNSHIIPECLYDQIYDDKHRYIPISSNNFNQLKIEQLGYREEMLCEACELKLSKWEKNTKKDLVDISKKNSNFLQFTKLNHKYTIVKKISHDFFKKCMLSILWRMSTTKSNSFKSYKLGPYQEKIRAILNNNDELKTFDFPIMVKQLGIDGKHYPDVIMCLNKGHIDNLYTTQSFVVYGYLIEIIISNKTFPKKYEPLLLNDNGTLPLIEGDLTSINHEPSLISRFNDKDVLDFYAQK